MELTQEHFDKQIENLVTKEDAQGFATKADLTVLAREVNSVRTEVSTVRSDLAGEMAGLRIDVKEIKGTVARLDKRDLEDSNAFAKDIVELKKDVKDLKIKHAS